MARRATQSRDSGFPSRSNSTRPLMLSPLTLPLNRWTYCLPFSSRVTVKETMSPSSLASVIGIALVRGWLNWVKIVPVSLSPSRFNLSVVLRWNAGKLVGAPGVDRTGRGEVRDHMPVGSVLLCARSWTTMPSGRSAQMMLRPRDRSFARIGNVEHRDSGVGAGARDVARPCGVE